MTDRPPCPVCDQDGNTAMIPGHDEDGNPIWVCTAGCYHTEPRDEEDDEQ